MTVGTMFLLRYVFLSYKNYVFSHRVVNHAFDISIEIFNISIEIFALRLRIRSCEYRHYNFILISKCSYIQIVAPAEHKMLYIFQIINLCEEKKTIG